MENILSEKTGAVAEPHTGAKEAEPAVQPQSTEENSKYASARRNAENELKEFKTRVSAYALKRGFKSFDEMAESDDDFLSASDIDCIRAIDGSIGSFEELKNMDGYDEFKTMVKKGYAPTDAYRLVNFDAILKSRISASRQALLNSLNDKAHLKASGGSAEVDTRVVPSEIYELYKKFNPNATDKQIREHYYKNEEMR